MNQFKKAKQQLGNQTESVTDLKTAGVAPKKEETTKNNKTHSDIATVESTPQIQPVAPTENTNIQQTNSPTISDSSTEIIIPEAVETSVSTPKPEVIPQPVFYNEGSLSEVTTVQPQSMSSPQYTAPVVQTPFPEPTVIYTQPVESKTAKSNKKSVPNMFTQKTESKSIRKSLVLKPTSVKKAENYCAKNGGSFNELIQILLDNFIEEYDL